MRMGSGDIMIDVKQKIRENQERQRAIVDAFHKKIREEAIPFLRQKKIAHIRRVDELQDDIHEKWVSKKENAREHVKAQKEKHKANVRLLDETIISEQKKQRANANLQIEKARSSFKTTVTRNREIIESRKMNRRMKEKNKGKLLFAGSTMPTKDFSDHLSYSPGLSTSPDPEYAKTLNTCFKSSTLPDPNFADVMAYSPKHPEPSKPELQEATMLPCKLSLMPKPKLERTEP